MHACGGARNRRKEGDVLIVSVPYVIYLLAVAIVYLLGRLPLLLIQWPTSATIMIFQYPFDSKFEKIGACGGLTAYVINFSGLFRHSK